MLKRAVVLFGCFATATVLIAKGAQSEPTPIRAALALFPMTIGEWHGLQQPPFDEKTLGILRVDDYLTRAYVIPSQSRIGLYIGYWQSQRQGDTIHSPLNCLPGSGWEPLSKSSLRIPVMGGLRDAPTGEIDVNRYVVQKGLDRELVVYWYQSHGRVVASEYLGKIYLVADAVRLNRTDAALVRVIAPIGSNVEGAEARAERDAIRFVQALFPKLTDYLPL